MSDPTQLYAQAIDALNRGQWHRAQQFAEQVARHAPRHGGVHFIAGVAALQQRQIPLALGHLQRATQYSPDRADYFAQYARALAMVHDLRQAVTMADIAMQIPSTDPIAFDTLGVVYTKANAHARAAQAFQHAVDLEPEHANYRFNLAVSHMFHGDVDAAEREYEACVRIDPTYWRAHLGLSHLRRQTAERNHVVRTQELLHRHTGNADAEIYLHLSLAKEFEDLGDYPAAYGNYTKGKAAHGKRIGSTAARDTADFRAVEAYFTEPPHGTGDDSREPIFVMGMPRTGTTLVDRILSSHSRVHSAGELGHFAVALQRVAGRPARTLAEIIGNLPTDFDAWSALGRAYVESTRPGTGHTPHFVDKLPHNFLYAGFIATALPNARLVCLRRNPMDTCLSNFRQLFALESPNHDYSYDLLDTGRYFLLFDRLMRFWQSKFPGRILEIDYEALVSSQEDTTRRLLAFCDLSWDEACVRFEQNAAPVATASALQVRSGMNRESMQRWKRYEPQLHDLRQLLESAGVVVDG